MTDQLKIFDPELSLYIFVVCSHLTNIQNFWLLWYSCTLYSGNSWTAECEELYTGMLFCVGVCLGFERTE